MTNILMKLGRIMPTEVAVDILEDSCKKWKEYPNKENMNRLLSSAAMLMSKEMTKDMSDKEMEMRFQLDREPEPKEE